MNSRCSLASSTWKRISWWNDCCFVRREESRKYRETNKTYFHEIQVQDHVDGRSDFILQTMHFETHTLEHDLCTCGKRDLLQECRHLRAIECRRGKEYVELDWEKPERCNIILTRLVVQDQRVARQDREQNTHKLHYPSDCPLNIDAVIAVNGNQARRTANGRELDKSRVVGHDRLEVL